MEKLNSQNFADTIKEGVTVVDFYADWCGPCQVLVPLMESLSTSRTDCTIAKLNVDESTDIASDQGVMSLPTVVFYKDGVEVHRIMGVNDADTYNAEIDKLL